MNDLVDDVHPALQTTAADHAEAALRSLTSVVDVAVPGLGSLFGELISYVIPNTRKQRIEQFLTSLARRLSATERSLEEFAHRLSADQQAIFEEGAWSAARSTSEARIERLAAIVARGMTASDIEAEHGRTVIQLLEQLSELDLLVLDAFVSRMGPDPRGRTWGQYIPQPDLEGLDERASALALQDFRERVQEAQALEAYRLAKLQNLNLLEQNVQLQPGHRRNLDGSPGAPSMVREPPRLTALGRMLLRMSGLGQGTWEGVLDREQQFRAEQA